MSEDKDPQTITVKEIMARTGVKSPKSIYHRALKGDFEKMGRATYRLDERAELTMLQMRSSRSKNAGRKKEKKACD